MFTGIESIPEALRPNHPAIIALATTGMALHNQLKLCMLDTLLCPESQDSPFHRLDKAFLHAMSLFHCKNFTYYSCWDRLTIPILSLDEITAHSSAALDICSSIVTEPSGISVVILLFPLRMVGVHTVDVPTRVNILKILTRIHQDGFVVADRIKADLQEYWAFQDDVSRIVEETWLDS